MLFDEWNHDGFSSQSWQDGEYSISAERDGKLYWAMFNTNPAAFCTDVIVVGWEQFLDGEPPVATSPGCLRAIRAHLKAERGRSTHAILRPAKGWLLDGKPLAQPELPGPQGAGVGTWHDRSSLDHERVLLTPGEHRFSLDKIERTITVRAGERCEVNA